MSGEDVQDRRVAGERARARSGTARRLLLLATSLVVAAVGLELGFRGVQSLRGRPYDAKDTRLRLLNHLFQHQTHHRGQVHAMLSGTSVAPPQLDEFFCAMDAPLREQEFAELGFSEAAIWGPPG